MNHGGVCRAAPGFAIAACGAGPGVNLYLLVTCLQKGLLTRGWGWNNSCLLCRILVKLGVISKHCLGPLWIVFKSSEKEQSGLLHMICSGLWVGRHWGLTVIGIVRNFAGGWPRCRVSGRSSCRARGVLLLVVCGLTNVTCGGDQAATLADDPKRSVTRGKAVGGTMLLGGRAGTNSPWGFRSGEAGRQCDCICLCLGLTFIRYADEYRNYEFASHQTIRKNTRGHVVSVPVQRLEMVSDVCSEANLAWFLKY